jgi:hypothetical protein
MALLNRVVQHCAPRVVLLQSRCFLVYKILDNLVVTASSCVDERRASFRTRQIDIRSASLDQTLYHLVVSFYRGAV